MCNSASADHRLSFQLAAQSGGYWSSCLCTSNSYWFIKGQFKGVMVCFWMESFVLFPLQRFTSPNDHLEKLSSLIHYLVFSFFFSPRGSKTNHCWLQREALKWQLPCIWAAMLHLSTTSGKCSSHAALHRGTDFQMMTLVLVKSTLVLWNSMPYFRNYSEQPVFL